MNRLVWGFAGVAVAVTAWWVTATLSGLPPVVLPTPPQVADAYTRHGPYLLQAATVTIWHVAAGYTLAAIVGVTLAVALAASRRLRAAATPVLVAAQNTPKVAFAGLFVIWLGYNHASKITLAAVLCLFPVLVNTLAGLTTTPTDLIDLARSLSATRWQTFRRFRLPHALPQVFAGLRISAGLALIGVVVAQLTTPNAGLGAVLARAGADTPLTFAAVALLAAIGLALYYTIAEFERRLLPWVQETTK